MPKIPKKKARKAKPSPSSAPYIPLRFVADELQTIRIELADAAKRIDHLYVSLFTVGFDEVGPIVETKDDIPF